MCILFAVMQPRCFFILDCFTYGKYGSTAVTLLALAPLQADIKISNSIRWSFIVDEPVWKTKTSLSRTEIPEYQRFVLRKGSITYFDRCFVVRESSQLDRNWLQTDAFTNGIWEFWMWWSRQDLCLSHTWGFCSLTLGCPSFCQIFGCLYLKRNSWISARLLFVGYRSLDCQLCKILRTRSLSF